METPTILPDDIQDRWLDHRTHTRSAARKLWHSYINFPREWARQFIRFAKTTPGTITAVIMLLSILTLSAGISMSQIAADRRKDFDTLINNTEPVSYMAHDIYSSLSYANTAASSGFVLAGIESHSSRNNYTDAYQRAARAIATTANGINNPDSEEMRLIQQLSQQLPIYTGLVETAWANNRQQNPVGVAYMSEASTLMREHMLPAASRLYQLTSHDVEEQQQALTQPLWQPISGLIAALTALIVAQFWLATLTNRRLNKGMLTAFLLMLLATSWVVTTGVITWHAGSKAYNQASAPIEALIKARIDAQQTRTNEMLALVWRQSLENSNKNFETTADSIRESLQGFSNQTAQDAEQALDTWASAHAALVDKLNAGDYEQAQALALETTNAQSYTQLDTNLAQLIDDTRTTMRSYINQGIAASTLVSTIVLMLSIISVLSLWIGIRPRLQEYL
ncbi:phenol hydroxylase [Corynebacterium felinum]|uniref:Phenol hydroxylase n=1 Tax=Corynebacterium felinum TaxID=131318 RepID=A0ABU2B5L3_9CORY|nr:phenol hydroxylase [Corynebacterium felinum]MDF5820146.1 phenol hydroxylase [Corynebacterium felinum]MDR7353898.1 hypothetical protein [Corynebacterium felinum]WJY96071.1 hypothetical protein CFELI_12450 [Corynebacterium felinum]